MTSAAEPVLLVPDEQTALLAGFDPVAEGLRPVLSPAAARRVVRGARVPESLREPLASLEAEVDPVDHAAEPHGGGHGHEGHDMGGHDHGDMMAIVGEPSADGLVMEPIGLRFGPLATPLPAGLVVDVSLDGDVVSAATVEATLAGTPGSPDALARPAWNAARPDGGVPIAQLELHRAASHVAWLRSFARLLGWPTLVGRAVHAWGVLRRGDLPAAEAELAELAAFLERSRRFRRRTGGRGAVAAERARELGLRGPNARAGGIADDARASDPAYARLGFSPVVRTGGDVRARALLRAEEAREAVRLARRAGPSPLIAGSGAVEGPRGPLRAGPSLAAPGEAAAVAAAGELMRGHEWSTALVVAASLDLSPWRVPE